MTTEPRIASCLLAALTIPAFAQNPADTIAALEARLDAADRVQVEFEVSATGAVTADVRGRLHLQRNGTTVLEATGQFAGAPVDVALTADADSMLLRGGSADSLLQARPPALADALLIGFVRMGILHNVARLTAAAAPDHGDGGVRSWVTLEPLAERENTFEFALTVAGEPAGTATLSLDTRGLPVRREQRVAFPEGEMRVSERYLRIDVAP
jgi:hypothetical protein